MLKTNKSSIDMSNLKSGMYIVRVALLNGQFVHKKVIKK